MYLVSCKERTRFRRIASKSRQKAKDILADLNQFNSKYKILTMDNFETGFSLGIWEKVGNQNLNFETFCISNGMSFVL